MLRGGRRARIADARIAEAAQAGADVVATACPFCSQMLGSASGASAGFVSTGASEPQADGADSATGEARRKLPEVRDVAVMLLEAVERGR